jgi:hypothetical protein
MFTMQNSLINEGQGTNLLTRIFFFMDRILMIDEKEMYAEIITLNQNLET